MVALVVAAVSPYLASLTFDYVLDDRLIVRQNEAIRGWSALLTLWTKPYWITAAGEPGHGLYRPAFMVILSILWNAGLRYPIFFHLLAVSTHAVSTVLVFQLTRRVLPPLASAAGAVYFAVQPVHVEAVANIANSSEVLVAVATLTLALLLLRADARIDGTGMVSWTTAIGASAIFALAVLTKESGITAPALALVAVWGWREPTTSLGVPSRDTVRAAWERWRPFIVACAVVVVIVVAARVAVLQSLVSRESIAAEGLGTLTAWQRMWAMLGLGPKIVELLAWPGELNPMYGPRALAGNTGPNVAATLFVGVLALVAWLAWRTAMRGDRRMASAVAWALLAFAPASNLLVPTGQVLAERTLYVSSIGVAMLVGLIVDAAARRLDRVGASVRRPAAAVVMLLVTASAVQAIGSTSRRTLAWKDHGALFLQAIKADPSDYRPHMHLAQYRLAMGDTAAAREALARMMSFPEARSDPDAVAAFLRAQRPTAGGRK